MHVLDNPVWHALTGPQQTVAEGQSLARRYDPEIAPFAALPDAPSPASWDAMRDLIGPRGVAVLFRDAIAAPTGWEEIFRMATAQMIATAVEGRPAAGAHVLGTRDVPEMLRLIEATQPGPFAVRTIELGTYVALRVDGAIVAMAGERMHAPGHTEISAVCTVAEHRGRGLASTLVRDLVHRVNTRGEVPILHVLASNTTAIALYTSLGFTVRRTFDVVAWRALP